MPESPELRRLLWFLLGGTRGGENRARIISQLRERPSNLNQLARQLGLEYRAVKHHMEVLRRNSLVLSSGEKYGVTYLLTPWLESNYGVFEEICTRLNFEVKSGSD
jgi:DNA-binding transcriptional ArsR family regulator